MTKTSNRPLFWANCASCLCSLDKSLVNRIWNCTVHLWVYEIEMCSKNYCLVGILAPHVFRENRYRKVASSGMSRLVAHPSNFRMFMKGKFDSYVLWPLAKSFQNWIVDRSTCAVYCSRLYDIIKNSSFWWCSVLT